MSASILFIDSEHAKIYSLTPEKVDALELKKSDHKSHAPPEYNVEHEKHFFSVIAEHLKGTGELLILGPSYAKNNFHLYLQGHDENLVKSIVGIETIEHLSDAQILEFGRRFFKVYDLYHDPLTPQ